MLALHSIHPEAPYWGTPLLTEGALVNVPRNRLHETRGHLRDAWHEDGTLLGLWYAANDDPYIIQLPGWVAPELPIMRSPEGRSWFVSPTYVLRERNGNDVRLLP